VGGQINGDSSKISVFGYDSLKCHDDPFDVVRFNSKNNVAEFCRFGEIE